MRGHTWSFALMTAAAATFVSSPADAQIRGDGAVVATAIVGTLAGVTNSIAVTVYAVDGRALGSGWVVSSLFSSAICGATAVSFIVSGATSGANVGKSVGTIFYALLAAWPAYYVIRSSLSEADPGEYFDAEVAPDEVEDPIGLLLPQPSTVQPIASWGFRF